MGQQCRLSVLKLRLADRHSALDEKKGHVMSQSAHTYMSRCVCVPVSLAASSY